MEHKIVLGSQVHASVRARLEAVGAVVENTGGAPWERAVLLEHARDAEALMVFMTEAIDAAFLDECPRLRIVAGALKGYNNIDVAACSQRGIPLTVVPDLLTLPTAELTVGLMVALTRNIVTSDRSLRSDGFAGWRPLFFGGSLVGATVAIVGAGAVGRAVMRMARGFDCRFLYVDPVPLGADEESALGARTATLDEARAEADFLVLGLHLTPETRRLVDADFIAGMKPGARLINPARGSLVDEAAVAEALAAGHLAGYAADTFAVEDWALPDRPGQVHPMLLNSDKTVLTPHIGSAVRRAREAIEASAAESIVARLAGRMPETAVNAAALQHSG